MQPQHLHDACDAVVKALHENVAPVDGWTMPELRRVTGLTVGAFAAALIQLRRDGKVHPYDLALTRAAWPVAEPVTVTGAGGLSPSLVEAVAAEVRAEGANRKAARTCGLGAVVDRPSIGAQLQEKAMHDAPLLAAGIVRDRWAPTWERLCRHAQAKGQKPVIAMIALLDQALDQGLDRALDSAREEERAA